MKPTWRNGVFGVELHKPDIAKLDQARAIGQMLGKLHQPEEGQQLIDAVDAIIEKFGPKDE